MTWDDGTLDDRPGLPRWSSDPRLSVPHTWKKGALATPSTATTHLASLSSTFAPSWSVSGEELLRAWR